MIASFGKMKSGALMKLLMKLTGFTIILVASFNLFLGFHFTVGPELTVSVQNSMKQNLHIKDHFASKEVISSYQKGEVSTVISENNVPKETDHHLPKWVTEYFQWHNEMRKKYPGKAIVEDPTAPKILMRTCIVGLCGGLHDRLGQLPMDLYIANQTNRLLLIQWSKPAGLDQFMVPPDLDDDFVDKSIEYSIDWRVPASNVIGTTGKRRRQIEKIGALPFLISNVRGVRKKKEDRLPYNQMFDRNIYNLTKGQLKDEKAVIFEVLGTNDEDYLEQKLKEAGETDMIHNTPSFGKIFQSFFQPSPNVMKEYKNALKETGLVPHDYTAVHCRVRHPGGYSKGRKFNGIYAGKADRYIPDFVGGFKDEMATTAIRAFQCAETLPGNDDEQSTFYFMSDMSDLVTYMAFNLTNKEYVSSHPEWFSRPKSVNSTAERLVSRHNIRARKQTSQNLHIDKARPTELKNFYGSFVDLWIGIKARCVAYGVGNYARFAAKISHTDCVVKYQKQTYGAEVSVDSSKECKVKPLDYDVVSYE